MQERKRGFKGEGEVAKARERERQEEDGAEVWLRGRTLPICDRKGEVGVDCVDRIPRAKP